MADPLALSADQILAIPDDQPERLFSAGTLDSCKDEFRRLARKWHSDRNPDAPPGVFAHINKLHEAAISKISGGLWETPWLFEFEVKSGQTYRIRHLRKHTFPLGSAYICRHSVNYRVDRDFVDLASDAQRTLKGITYADDKMRAEVARALPTVDGLFELQDRSVLLRLNKGYSHLCLRDVLTQQGGRLDPRHVAWILSRLYGLCAFLQHAGLMHGDISPDTVFVDPTAHVCSLIGGWWYARGIGQKMSALPSRTIDNTPVTVIEKKRAAHKIDLGLIKLTGRELLGDAVGSRLSTMKDVAAPVASWLRMPAGDDPLKEFQAWHDTLNRVGPRKFVEFNLSEKDVYKEK